MKRELALVSYSSSEDSETESSSQPAKKRKLPVLSSTLVGPPHVDDPSLHQGRIRTTPHVDGQYATHIYGSVPLERSSALFKLLCKVIGSAKNAVPTLHDFWSSPKDCKPELHISLSRPIFLRSHQREEMKRAVRCIAEKTSPFTASFAHVSELVNDEGTRIFLALEIGAGHHELSTLTTLLTPALRAMRQHEYYAAPRFHASIGWALLGGRPNSTQGSASHMDPQSSIRSESRTSSTALVLDEYPTITGFPPALLPALNSNYGSSLTGSTVKSFEMGEISIKIGKEVSRYRLNGT
ncbi:U6 snRNA phosphodiesterase Usb1 [Mycena rosella]|uniref:U6 snRNA phosphodiesterase n=1 Tax=Mycena rosella TaxID=1033263 RepID=A0AAD7DN29_MYCRO|nr:U6 snRNA phosphodiesterase Usb1 [Mycena rosella]